MSEKDDILPIDDISVAIVLYIIPAKVTKILYLCGLTFAKSTD